MSDSSGGSRNIEKGGHYRGGSRIDCRGGGLNEIICAMPTFDVIFNVPAGRGEPILLALKRA